MADHALRAREREPDPEGGLDLWLARARAGEDYAQAVHRALGLADLAYLETRRFAAGGQAHEVARFRHERTGLALCLIPGGTLETGAPLDRPGRRPWELPPTRTDVDPFLPAETPFTQAAWRAVLRDYPDCFFSGARRPVESVNWETAREVCALAGLRLPGELEWEHACRGGTRSDFALGAAITTDDANFNGKFPCPGFPHEPCREATTDVASFALNAFGLYDVHGNVWEWCEDEWRAAEPEEPLPGSFGLATDLPRARVIRGGSWLHPAAECRSRYRKGIDPRARGEFLGFRPARSLEPAP
ncbi:MAG: formylglycine-generating enzyme family protein [Planctomycetota bacterium]